MLDILEDYLELRGLVYGRLDGSMAFPERERQMTMFRESPDCMIFLLSTRAGGLGINLTSADTVIIYDSDWVRNRAVTFMFDFLNFSFDNLLSIAQSRCPLSTNFDLHSIKDNYFGPKVSPQVLSQFWKYIYTVNPH